MANNGTINVETSEFTLKYIHRIDAILLLLNIFILILSFTYRIVQFILIQLKCIIRPRQINNEIDDNDDDDEEECSKNDEHYQITSIQLWNKNNQIQYLTNDEIIKQLIYLILFISYLFYLFELLIIRVKIWKFSLFSANVLSFELLTVIITIIIHLIHYGLFYGKYFLLNIDRYRPVDHNYCNDQCSTIKIYKSQLFNQQLKKQIYLLILNYIAFNYFLLSACFNGAKLMILFQILAKELNQFHFQLIRFYLSTIIILLQTYFVIKHLKNLIIIWNWSKKNNPASNIANNLQFCNDIKYRRNYSTFLSKITFFWFIPILKLGYVQNLTVQNLGKLPKNELSFVQFERFYKHFNSIDVSFFTLENFV